MDLPLFSCTLFIGLYNSYIYAIVRILGELEKALETLVRGSYSYSISRSPKLPLAFLLNN